MVYGRKGIGKSTLASGSPDSLTAMFERGRRNLEILMVPQEGEPKLYWEAFKGYVNLFIESDLKTLSVDTVDRAYDACMAWVCRENGCTHPNDQNDFGKTWGMIKREFDDLFGLIHESGKGLIFVSHETPKPLVKTTKGLRREDSTVSTLERMEPSCSKQAFEVIQEICDYVFYYGYRDEHRCITVRSPNDLAWTSCGISNSFLDPNGNPINTFKVGSAENAYQSLVDAHANKLYDYDYEEPKKEIVFKTKAK